MSLNLNHFDSQQEACHRTISDTAWAATSEIAVEADALPKNPFEQVAGGLFDQFKAAHGEYVSPFLLSEAGVHHGFMVVGRGISNCVDGYLRYTAESGTEPDSQTCIEALGHPETIRFFTLISKMREEKNEIFEVWTGLRAASLIGNGFVYNPEKGCFTPNPKAFELAEVDTILWAIDHSQPTTTTDVEPRRCPATVYIPKLWGITVEACQATGLFDFQKADATS